MFDSRWSMLYLERYYRNYNEMCKYRSIITLVVVRRAVDMSGDL